MCTRTVSVVVEVDEEMLRDGCGWAKGEIQPANPPDRMSAGVSAIAIEDAGFLSRPYALWASLSEGV